MKIKGMDWMDWLHRVRQETSEQRKKERRTLSQHLKIVERGEGVFKDKSPRPVQKKK